MKLLRKLTAYCVIAASADIAFGAVSDARVDRSDPAHVIVTWSAVSGVDIYVADRSDADISSSKLLSTNNLDGRLMTVLSVDHRRYFLLQDRSDHNVSRVRNGCFLWKVHRTFETSAATRPRIVSTFAGDGSIDREPCRCSLSMMWPTFARLVCVQKLIFAPARSVSLHRLSLLGETSGISRSTIRSKASETTMSIC